VVVYIFGAATRATARNLASIPAMRYPWHPWHAIFLACAVPAYAALACAALAYALPSQIQMSPAVHLEA